MPPLNRGVRCQDMIEQEIHAGVVPRWSGRNIFIYVSFGLWLLSLCLPALISYNRSVYGYFILLIGWLGPLGTDRVGSMIGMLA